MNAKQVGNSDISMLKRAWEFIKYICIYNRAQIKTNVNVANKSTRDTSVSAVPVHFFYLNLISINTIMAPKVAKGQANLICLSKDSFHSTSLHPSTSYNCLLDIEIFSFLHLVSMCMFHWMARINPFFSKWICIALEAPSKKVLSSSFNALIVSLRRRYIVGFTSSSLKMPQGLKIIFVLFVIVSHSLLMCLLYNW